MQAWQDGCRDGCWIGRMATGLAGRLQAWQDGCRGALQDAVGKKKIETTLKKYRL